MVRNEKGTGETPALLKQGLDLSRADLGVGRFGSGL